MDNQIQPVTTMPIVKPISPILANEEGKVEVKPWYIWKASSTYVPSKVERVIADEFIKSTSWTKCVKAVKERCNKVVSIGIVQRCLERDHVKAFVAEGMEKEGVMAAWDEGRWYVVMHNHLRANAEWTQAHEEIAYHEANLVKNKEDLEAQVGLVNARNRALEASKKRLAKGDLYAMDLIAKYRGFGKTGTSGVVLNQQINFTERA